MSESGLVWAAVEACTLPTVERPLRVAEFDALFRERLRAVRRVSDTRAVLELSGGAEVAARALSLAERESACCAFFDFAVEQQGPDTVELAISVPEAQVAVLDGLVARAEAARDRGTG